MPPAGAGYEVIEPPWASYHGIGDYPPRYPLAEEDHGPARAGRAER